MATETFIANVKRAFRFVYESAPGLTIANAALVVLQGVLPLAALYLVKLVVDAVTTGLATGDASKAFGQVAFLIVLSGGVALFELIVSSIAGLINQTQAQVVTDHMHDLLHGKSIEVDLEYYENSEFYNTLHRAQQDAPHRPTRILNSLFQGSQSAISLAAIMALLISFHWSVPFFLFAAAVPVLLVRFRYARKMYSWQRRRTPTERKAKYFNRMLTGDSHAKEIRIFGLGSFFASQFQKLRLQIRKERLDLARARSMGEIWTQGGATAAAFGLYAFMAYRTLSGHLTVGDLIMCFQAVHRGQGFLKQLLSSTANLYEDNLFLSNFHEFLSVKPKVVEAVHPKPMPESRQRGVEFDHVSFCYPMDDMKVLDNVSLTIRPGEHVALVGENGAGKTTLIKLLCRLYDPSDGTIRVDGIDLREITIPELRREISVIFQDYARYQLTAYDNIRFGSIETEPDDELIHDAARRAGVHEVLSGLKNGYKTILGKWFDQGAELSVGEWQKIALARAFFRRSKIIVLDEPTSSMDAKAEVEIFENFHKLAQGRTAILISHRLSTVKMADRIYVVEHGKIVESGTHDELLYCGGRYAYLFETQAQRYR